MSNFTKTIFVFFIFIILPGYFTNIRAQSGQVAAGGQASGTGGTVSYSIGQVDYVDIKATTGMVNQGLQQVVPVGKKNIAPEKQLPPAFLNAKVYPNPAAAYVTLDITEKIAQNLSYALYTADGKLVTAQKINSGQQTISLSGLSGGAYFLVIQNNGIRVKSFTIVKTQ